MVHWARAGQGWQAAAVNRAMMLARPDPLLRAGVQELDTWPCGQVTCLASQSMANMSAGPPPHGPPGSDPAAAGRAG